jgi:dipeptidyl aminopeptidase/acylaminoacyl peptidase
LPRIAVSIERVPTFDELEVPVNVYLPRRLPPGKKLPVIVWVHGGPASASAVGWDPLLALWIAHGFAVVEPNVRGSTGFGKSYERADNGRKRMDAVKDLEHVNRWIREQPWADTERLVVGGGSYGGYMTYMALGHQPDLWHAGVGLVGVVNLVTFLKTTTGAIRLVFRDEFGELPQDREFLLRVSPLTAVREMADPLFVYQGANDPRVPRSEQDQLVRALRKQDIPVEYMVAADEGHSLSQRHNKLQFAGRSVRFLEQHLGLPGIPEACEALALDKLQGEEAGEAGPGNQAEPEEAETQPQN